MNYNKVFILGNLTRDPEVRTTPSGQSVASFGVATNRFWNNQSGERQQEVEFHNVVVWGKLAEIAGRYLNKGKLVFIEGRLKTRNWEDQSGVKHYMTEIIAENFQMGPRTGGEGGGGYSPSSNNDSDITAPPTINEDEITSPDDLPF